MNSEALDKRAQILFKALVQRYIRDGQPIGSKTLVEDVDLLLSPATVRHVLADLEARGYLCSPHASAGRVPTVQGYRFFVDSLLTIRPLSKKEVQDFKQALNPQQDTSNLVASASSLLSRITSLTGLVTMPKRKHMTFAHVGFLPLLGNRILVVLVLNGCEVQNRIIHTQRIFSESELQQAANYLNMHMVGVELSQLKHNLRCAMRHDKDEINQLLQAAIDLSHGADDDFILSGQSRLWDMVDTSDILRLRALFEAFTQKRDILHLLEQCLEANGVQIFIGEESGYGPLGKCSLVAAPYSVQGQVVGVLAVIGSTRMAYERVIPVVDITAKLLSAALNNEV